MTDGPFDHLELSSGDNTLPNDVQTALWDSHFRRIEIGPVEGAPPKTYAVRLDGVHVFCSDERDLSDSLRVLFNYVDKHGVTPPLLDYIHDQNRQAEAVAGIPRPPGFVSFSKDAAHEGRPCRRRDRRRVSLVFPSGVSKAPLEGSRDRSAPAPRGAGARECAAQSGAQLLVALLQ